MPTFIPYIVYMSGEPVEEEDDDGSIYTQEEMVYLEDESDSEIEEVHQEPGDWANPIDLTLTSDEEGGTDSEEDTSSDDESSDGEEDEYYLV